MNKWHAEVDIRGFGTKQDFIPLFFFMYVDILWQNHKQFLYNLWPTPTKPAVSRQNTFWDTGQ